MSQTKFIPLRETEFALTSRCSFSALGVYVNHTRSPLKESGKSSNETLPNRLCKKPAVGTLARVWAQLRANCRFRSFPEQHQRLQQQQQQQQHQGQSVVEGVNAFDGDVNSM